MQKWIHENAGAIADALIEKNSRFYVQNHVSIFGIKNRVIALVECFKTLLFPGVFEIDPVLDRTALSEKIERTAYELNQVLLSVFVLTCEKDKGSDECCERCIIKARETTEDFLSDLPKIREILNTDIEAAYNGDPAARSMTEIILSYPSIEAVFIYRLAHKLFTMEVPLIPRIMTEHAHQLTGIDIHPGATIGTHFFIDHGTGVVVGETCVIGSSVKLYQGVTLGAKSFQLDESGNPVKGIKRHPNIEDNVVIYAGATILGGDTVVGHDSVIGGNVWLIDSVPPNTTIYNKITV